MFTSTQIAFFIFGSGPMPEAPVTVNAASVRLRGKDLSTKETGFRDEVNLPEVNSAWATLGTRSAMAGSGTDFDVTYSGLTYNTHYRFRSVPFNVVGDAINNLTVDYFSPPEFAPVLSVSNTSSYSQLLTWTIPLAPLSGGYVVSRLVGGVYIDLETVAAPALSYLVTGIPAATQQTYRIRAYNAINGTATYSGFSSVAVLATAAAPAAHSALAVTKGAIHLWRANEAAGLSAMVDSIGGKNATVSSPGIYSPIFGSYKIIGGPDGNTDTSIYSNGNDGNEKIQATGLAVSVPFTLEVIARMQEDGAIAVLDAVGTAPRYYLFGSAAGNTGSPNMGALVPDGIVRHYAVTYGANSQKFYVNGVLIATNTGSLSATLDRITFCEWPDNGAAGVMNLSHSAIYPTALSAGDVSELHLSALAPIP